MVSQLVRIKVCTHFHSLVISPVISPHLLSPLLPCSIFFAEPTGSEKMALWRLGRWVFRMLSLQYFNLTDEDIRLSFGEVQVCSVSAVQGSSLPAGVQ